MIAYLILQLSWNTGALSVLPGRDWSLGSWRRGSGPRLCCARLMADGSARAGRLQRAPAAASQGRGPRGLRRPRLSPMALPWAVLPSGSVGREFTGAGHAGLPHRVWFQVFQQLKAAHSALEEEYLKACREQHPAQRLAGSMGAPGKFDPGRYCWGGRLGRTEQAGPLPQSPGGHASFS